VQDHVNVHVDVVVLVDVVEIDFCSRSSLWLMPGLRPDSAWDVFYEAAIIALAIDPDQSSCQPSAVSHQSVTMVSSRLNADS
jgi:hypothetical protein